MQLAARLNTIIDPLELTIAIRLLKKVGKTQQKDIKNPTRTLLQHSVFDPKKKFKLEKKSTPSRGGTPNSHGSTETIQITYIDDLEREQMEQV